MTKPATKKYGKKAGDKPAEKKTNSQIYKEAAQIVIEAIKEGAAPWMKPWDAEKAASFQLPHNPVSKTVFRGGNVMILMAAGMANKWEDPRWMTYKQAESKGWQVRKGETSKVRAIFFQPKEIETDELDAKGDKIKRTIPLLKTFAMFNAAQVDGVPELTAPPKGFKAVDAAEEIIDNCGTTFKFGGDQLTYNIDTDTVQMPQKAAFVDHNYFYATAMHGAARGTAHPSRLERELAAFEDNPLVCAKEEMRVEIAAMMISADLGLAHDPANHIAYIAQWVEMLERDPQELFRAARDAEAIRNHLVAFATLDNDQVAEADAQPVFDEPQAPADEAGVTTEPAVDAMVETVTEVLGEIEEVSPQAAAPAPHDFMSALDFGMDALEPADATAASQTIEDQVEHLIFTGNAGDVIEDVRNASGNVDTGLELGDLDALLGLKPSKPSPDLSF